MPGPVSFMAGGLIRQLSVTVPHGEILTLPSSPVEVVADPGANKLIVPVVIMLHMKWAADYSNISPDALMKCDLSGTFIARLAENTLSGITALLAGGGPDGTWVAMTINQLSQAATTSATPNIDPHIHQGAADSGFYDSDIVNKPLLLSVEGNSSNFTGGDGANELQVSAAYMILNTITGLFE